MLDLFLNLFSCIIGLIAVKQLYLLRKDIYPNGRTNVNLKLCEDRDIERFDDSFIMDHINCEKRTQENARANCTTTGEHH